MSPEYQILALCLAWGSAAVAVFIHDWAEIEWARRPWLRKTAVAMVSPAAFVLLPCVLALTIIICFAFGVWGLTYPLNPHARWMVRQLRAYANERGETRLANVTVRNIRFVLGGFEWEQTYNHGSGEQWFAVRRSIMPSSDGPPPNWSDRSRLVRRARKMRARRGGR